MNKFKNIKAILSIIITIIIFTEVIYYGYFFLQKQKAVKELSSQKKELEIDISTLKGMTKKIKIDNKFIKYINSKYKNKKYIFGAEITDINVIKKISIPNKNKAYYLTEFKFKAKSFESLRLLLMLLYMDIDIVKIVKVDTFNRNIKMYIEQDLSSSIKVTTKKEQDELRKIKEEEEEFIRKIKKSGTANTLKKGSIYAKKIEETNSKKTDKIKSARELRKERMQK